MRCKNYGFGDPVRDLDIISDAIAALNYRLLFDHILNTIKKLFMERVVISLF
jgi:hypothetical protein